MLVFNLVDRAEENISLMGAVMHMSTNSAPSLEKIFSTHDLFRGRARLAWAWSVAGAILLIPLVIVLGLFIGLLTDQGRLTTDLSREDNVRFTQLTGLPLRTAVGGETNSSPVVESNEEGSAPKADGENDRPLVDKGQDRQQPVEQTVVRVSLNESGILPVVWRARQTWWGPGVAWCFRTMGWFQSNVLAAISLLLLGVLLLGLRFYCLSRHRRACHWTALQAVVAPRKNLHRQVLRLGPEDLDGSVLTETGKLFSQDVEQVRRGLYNRIEHDTRFPLEMLCLALIAFSIHPFLALQTALLLGVIGYLLERERKRAAAEYALAKDRADVELRHLVDGFRGATLIRGLGVEQTEHEQFGERLDHYHELAAAEDRAAEYAAFPHWFTIGVCSAIAALLLFRFAANVLLNGTEFIGGMIAIFLTTWVLAIPAALAMRRRMGICHDAALAADRIQREVERIPTVGQAVGAKFLNPLTKALHIDQVSYAPPGGQPLLSGVDLKLDAGKVYSLVSINPLEAQALTKMLPRFLEPQSGRILFDGEDIAWATLESLRAECVFVSANDPPLPGTVLDNIRGGRSDYTLQQATEAAKTTRAHNFIVKLFNGYDTLLTGRDDPLDMGQRFRLNLARAILRNPALLIIEEPTEPLDEDAKTLLADAYDRICSGRTVIFLPTRLPTVRRSDEVIVLHEGHVAAIGPQAKLVNLSPIYRHWEYLHFNEFRHSDD